MKEIEMKIALKPINLNYVLVFTVILLLVGCSTPNSVLNNSKTGNNLQSSNPNQPGYNPANSANNAEYAKYGANATPGSEGDFIFNIGDHVYFLVNQTSLTYEGMETLRKQARWFNKFPHVQALIQGHADERGTREYNLALGAKRAETVFNFLINNGVNPARLSKTTVGKEKPKASCPNESCFSQNRRSVTILTNAPRI